MNERIVVTGLGCISPLGLGIPNTWNALLKGHSGIKVVHNLPITIAGSIPNFVESNSSIASRASQFALEAAKEAIADSALLEDSRIDHTRIGVSIGTSILSAIPDCLSNHPSTPTPNQFPKRISPRFIPKVLGNTASSLVAAAQGLQGPLTSPSSACATGAQALIDAWMLLKAGAADAMLVGSTEAPLNALSISGFLAMKALAVREGESDPSTLSQPFNCDRKGFVIAEGASILVLERLSNALERGARIYCEVGGVGLTGARNPSQTSLCEDSVYRSMRAALERGQIERELGDQLHGQSDLESKAQLCINAHATGTKQGDAAELRAIQRLVQDLRLGQVSVCATKASTGHLLAASGALEAAFSVLSLWHGWIPPTLNYRGEGAEGVKIGAKALRASGLGAVLSNSFGFGGVNASVLFVKSEW